MNVMGPRDRHDLQLSAKVLDIVQCPKINKKNLDTVEIQIYIFLN